MSRVFRCLGIASLLALLSAGRSSAADETYDLRGPAPKKGQTVREASKFTMKNADISIALGGDLKLDGKMDMVATTEKEMEILGVDGRNVTKLRSKILKDSSDRKTTIAGTTENQTDKKAIEGEIVFSELKDKKWKHILEDTKPNEKQEKELKNFDDPENDDELYPAEKIKVGHTWNIEPSAFKKLLGSKVTDPSGKGKSKFLRTEKVGDELCAVIESEIDIKGKMKDDDGNEMKIEMKGKVQNHRSIAMGMDLKFTIEGTATFSGDVDQDGQKAKIRFSGKMSGEGATEIKKR